MLLEARDIACRASENKKGSPAQVGDPKKVHTGPLTVALFCDGSTKRAMVGATGLEPMTCWL